MSKEQLLSELNKINSSASQIGSAADLVGADELAGKIHQVQDKVAKASDAVSTAKNTINNIKNATQQGLSSTSIDSLAGNVGAIAGLTGNEKLASHAAKVQQRVSQAKQAVSMAGDVIHRVKSVGSQAGKALKPINGNETATTSFSPFELLSALFKRTPSGLQFTLEAGTLAPTTFSVISFNFSSHYNKLDRLEVAVSSPDSAINAANVLDNHAVLSVWQDGVLQQTFSGMVSDFEQGDSGFRLTHYHLTIRPDLWRATLRHNSRIFQKKDIETILTTILFENKVMDYAFILRNPHPEREFCVQYQETDFDFFQRLTAEEGIFYYFEHRDGQHRLILTDDVATLGQSVSLPYNPNKNAQLQEKCITSLRRREQLRPSRVELKDYTFKKPNWQASFEKGTGYEHYDYPGRFKDGRGKQYTQYRLDGLRQDAHLGEGVSNSPNLQVGKLFSLTGHPKVALNTLWQPVGVRYEGQQPQSSELEAGGKATTLIANFEFIPSHQTWRPAQRTKPRVEGPQMAIVTGPKGEEIYTDNFGRIRLQFLWDREGQYDDHSSCWVRVTQPWAGKGWGMMAIPRVGHEVVVNFLDGDPDQPIVTGRAYHANNLSPAGLPANKTQMHIMSQTYKGGGYNGVMMEDSPGAQRLDFQAQKDMTTDVLNNKSTQVNNEHSESVAKAQNITVQGNRNKNVSEAELVSLSKNSINEVKANHSLMAEKTLIVSSQTGGISLVAGGASIALDNEGNVFISGSGTVKVNGQDKISINSGKVSDANGNPVENEEEAEAEESEEGIGLMDGLMAVGMLALTRGRGKGALGKASKVTGKAKSTPKAVNATKPVKMKEVKPNTPFKRNPKHDKVEFDRQLKDQQDAINKMSAKDWLKNREAFKNRNVADYNRRAKQARDKYREKVRESEMDKYRSQGLSREEASKKADEYLKGKAALHNPDAVAGGNVDKISGLGDSKVNSSLGSQWKTRAESIEQQVKQQYGIPPKTIDDIPNDAMMNINLF